MPYISDIKQQHIYYIYTTHEISNSSTYTAHILDISISTTQILQISISNTHILHISIGATQIFNISISNTHIIHISNGTTQIFNISINTHIEQSALYIINFTDDLMGWLQFVGSIKL